MASKCTLKCDYCGKEAEVRDNAAVSLPKEWITWAYHRGSFACYDDWRITHHFCCPDHSAKATELIGKAVAPKTDKEGHQ